MFFNSIGWWSIIALNFVGYFGLRFGMVSRGASRKKIEFVGGLILSLSFILMFIFEGIKSGLILIPIFWIVVTPIIELLIGKIDKKINEPYEESYKHLAQEYNSTPEEVKKEIYKNMDKSDDEIIEAALREHKFL